MIIEGAVRSKGHGSAPHEMLRLTKALMPNESPTHSLLRQFYSTKGAGELRENLARLAYLRRASCVALGLALAVASRVGRVI